MMIGEAPQNCCQASKPHPLLCVVCSPLEEPGDAGSGVPLQLLGQLKDVLHHNGLVGYHCHQRVFLRMCGEGGGDVKCH